MKTVQKIPAPVFSSLLVGLFLIVIVWFVFGQIVGHEFVNFDDGIYVANNKHVKSGLSVKNVIWAFTTMQAEFWHPLTWLSLMVDTDLYGAKPAGYLCTSLLLHMVNSLLLFAVFRWMTGAVWHSGLVAVLFAIHPLHVEPVAWISARKDLLSTLFWMLTMLSYLYYVKRPGLNTYLVGLICFLAGLMAKPMLVTLPFVLLLIDYWPLGRISNDSNDRYRIKAVIWEKLPFIVLSIVAGIVAYLAQKAGGGIGTVNAYPFPLRIANALVSYATYLIKTVWPHNLSFFYPFDADLALLPTLGACILLVSISLSAVKLAEKYPYIVVGWLWYLGTLLPVIGLIKIGGAAMADRYTYVPLIGVFIIIVWGVSELLVYFRWKKIAVFLIAVVFIFQFIMISRIQAGFWANSTRLFEHAIDVTKNNYVAYGNLGNVKFRQGKIDEAIVCYIEALKIRPLFPDALNGMGAALARTGRLNEAARYFQKALTITPDDRIIQNNLGRILAHQKKG